ncbi:uncharacterized protein LOC127850700 isoform X2 [Dreissena polymorpha]|nr:uncharacterized protein LOC127850700 isoform X2 [Dreissena polymorpha]XP_052239917.1 uncharacterized protein LOC127850700 isoform X2 [Dreissena polymorpha]
MTKESFENRAAELLQQNKEHSKNETQIDATVNSQQNHIAQLTKLNEDLEKKLKHEEEKYEQIKTTKENFIDNLETNKSALTDKIKEQNDQITSLENECTKCTTKNAELTELSSKLAKELKEKEDKYQHMLSEKDKQIQRIEITLKESGASITKSNETIKNLNEQNIELEQDIAQLKKRISKMETETQHYNTIVSEKHNQIERLMTKNKNLEEEKKDALRRLSAMMSVKLRDNNPNIADLSDQFRPTKLGEQFSELYDNEWTDAFDALQNNFEERHAISILLDIVMESYQFCDQQLVEVWTFAENWFIDKDVTTAQQISKTLKDVRKQKVIGRVEDIQQKYTGYLLKVCNTEHLDKLITSDPLRNFISTCVRLALLMTANDPPVVIECPGWQRFSERPYLRDTVLHSSPNDCLSPEELNNDKEKKSTSNTIDEAHLIATQMNDHEAGKVDNIFSNQIKHNADNMDCIFSTPVRDDGMNPKSNLSVVHETQTNASSSLYLENDVEEKIYPADTSKEHGQESNNLSKMEPCLDASPDVNVNFEPTDSTPEMLSNKINDTDTQYDVQTVEVRNDKPQSENGSKDGPMSNISFALSEQRHNADGHSGGPKAPQNSDAKLTEKETSLNVQRIGEPVETRNHFGNKTKIVSINYECNFGTDSSQSQVANSPTYTDPNLDAPTDENDNIELPESTQTTLSNFIDGLCQQMVGLSLKVKENEAHQHKENGNASKVDVVEDETCDTKDGTWEGLSNEESGQNHNAEGHTGWPPEPLTSAEKFTETEGSFDVKRIEESEYTGNNAMTANTIDPTECYAVTDIARTQALDSPTGTNPDQDSQTGEHFIFKLQDISVEGTCEKGSSQHQAVEDDVVYGQINDSYLSNTKDGSLAGASDVKFDLQQCAERDIDGDQKEGEYISDMKDGPLEDMSDTVPVSWPHHCSMENTHDSQTPLLSDPQSTHTGVSFNDNRIEKIQQNKNDVNGNRTTAATGNSHDLPTEELKKVERPIFDKDKFKEYTSRGPYVDYFVWPIIYLHRDGPMLGKGIAQGSKDKMADGSKTLLVSWKTMP